MKAITLILFLSSSLFAQKKLTFVDVVQVDSISKKELYNRSLIWFANAFVSANDVIQVKDPEEGLIMAKAITSYTPSFMTGASAKGIVSYTFSIYVKDGRYKYVATDFYYDPYNKGKGYMQPAILTDDEECPHPVPMAKNWSHRVWLDIKEQVQESMELLITSMKLGMLTPAPTQQDDW